MPSSSVKSPKDYHQAFAEAFNAQDMDRLLSLYEPQATLVPGSEQVRGIDAIRAALEKFLALKGIMRIDTIYVVENGDLALCRGKWVLNGTDPTGKPVKLESSNIEVLRKQPDGRWVGVIDLPFGA